MKFQLEEFQAKAIDTVTSRIRRARRDFAEDGEITAVGLTAPTGAGKTVIAAGVLEKLYFGDAAHDPDGTLTVLWVTDDPSLNKQTIAKITQASDQIDEHLIRFLGDTDAPTLEPGFIYFSHIQQLQRNSTLHAVRDGVVSDHRANGAWDMIANTVRRRGDGLLVVVDEAHRGTSQARDRGTIVSTIINGGITNIGGQQPAAPVVLGISATPENFHKAMAAAGRTLKPVDVPPGDVRESGLLKDRILLGHLAEDQNADFTMLGLAVEQFRAYDEAWRRHHAETGDRRVEPVLVIQVEPMVTDVRLDAILSTVAAGWPALSDYAVAHCFGKPDGPLRVGDRHIRHIAPEAIEGDDRVRVVLFKSALTTGWDCPRAEVLVSFQNKESYTEIAQLIGRLVRTPLASRVSGDLLDSVTAYLPGFKVEHVVKVVNALTSEQAVESEVVIEPVTCVKSAPDEVFDLLGSLPTYTRTAATASSRTAQLIKLSRELPKGLVADAPAKARAYLVGRLKTADGLRAEEVDSKTADLLTLDVGLMDVSYGAEVLAGAATTQVAVSERDLNSYFALAERKFPDATAAWYWAQLCDEGLFEHEASARVAAMASLGFADVVETAATELIGQWRSEHGGAVSRLPKSVRERIQPLWSLDERGVVETTIDVPEVRREASQKVAGDEVVPIEAFGRHAYAIPSGVRSGQFPVVTTGWEREVLERELASDSLVSWYRNPSSGRHALAIPYAWGEGTGLLHPDFLFFHEDDGQLVVDIVDPHRHDDSATSAKWAALARYAAEHGDVFRRVVAVIRDSGGILRALDLRVDGMAERLDEAADEQKREALFDQCATNY